MGDFKYITIGDYNDPQARSHLYRYYAARGYIDPGDVVVDLACGAGYGTELLSQTAQKVIGIDRDEEAVKYAMQNHKKENNYFMVGNADQLEMFPECDVFVSIESLEHFRFPGSFASKIKMTTRKKIFLTTPIIPTKHEDSTHLSDFNEGQVVDMFVDSDWGCLDSSLQGPYLMISFYKK